MAHRQIPLLAYNWITGIGALVATVSFVTACVFLTLSIFGWLRGPYVGILIYLALPAVIVVGLVLIPFGMWRQSRVLRKSGAGERHRWPCIDLNVASTRNGVMIFAVVTLLYIFVSTVGVYQASRYTESVSFCGKLCHKVMKPEYVTHQISPHAIVRCTTCHVGPGPGWYEKSKVRGLGRVYDVLYAGYPRPIPAPIVDLKPTEIECHRCHWPENFFGGRRRIFHNRLYDEKNTYWPVQMVVHTGGGDPEIDQTGGIHWYMNIGYEIEYIARDRQRQDIAWVRATNKKTGEVTIYQNGANRLSEAEIASLPPRAMDCIDCHNSPAHIFHTPDYAIDMAIFLRQIDADLPDIKTLAVSAMAAPYATADDAASGIAGRIEPYYRKTHKSVYDEKLPEIRQAVRATRQRFAENIFPGMNVTWKVYPDNIGHLYYRGCFRCHLGQFHGENGKTIPHDCKTCHEIVAQGSGAEAQTAASPNGLTFEHPVSIGGIWKTMACSECHHGAGVGAAASIKPAPAAKQRGTPPTVFKPPVVLSADERTSIERIYDKTCAECHGSSGRPLKKIIAVMPMLPDFNDLGWQAAHSNADLEKTILAGKPPFMPAYKGKLGSVHPDQMVAYIRGLARHEGR